MNDTTPAVKARPHLAESVRLFHEFGDGHYELIASLNLAWVTGELGDVDGERRLHEQNLELARSLGNENVEAESLAQLAVLVSEDGHLDEAIEMIRQAVRIDHRRGMAQGVATYLGRLASVFVRQAGAETQRKGAILVASSIALTEQLGAPIPWWAQRRNEVTVARARSRLGDAEVDHALDEGRAMAADEAVALALEVGTE
jgi:tetratricopeptide (TPR) repeat protein